MRHLIVIILTSLTIIACENQDHIPPIQPLGNDFALFASGDGNSPAVYVLDADSLTLLDSISTDRDVAWTVVFSPDYSTWYSVWDSFYVPLDAERYLQAVDTRSMSIIQSTSVSTLGAVALSNDQQLVAYGDRGISVFDRVSFTLLKSDTSLYFVNDIIPSSSQSRLYMLCTPDRQFPGLVIYDIDSMKIDQIIPIADSITQRRMQPVDLSISPDERYAFISVFNWIGGAGYNSFIAFDLKSNEVVSEYHCGAFAQLAISPDGESVYITDPSGYLYQFITTGQILRYNVKSRQMEVFVERPRSIGLLGNLFVSDRVVVAPDNRTVFISMWGGDGYTTDGRFAAIIKIDALTRELLGTYSYPLDIRGIPVQLHARGLALGKYSRTERTKRR